MPINARLPTAGRNGATQPLLTAQGFGVSMIAELFNQGLAILTRLRRSAPAAKLIALTKVRIMEAGRDALRES